MIEFTTVGTNDLPRAIAFYDALFAEIGIRQIAKFKRGVGWGMAMDKPTFSVMTPFDGKPATVGNGTMIGLALPTQDQVKALHARALVLGATDEGAPGDRGDGFYGAYFRDLDGNKIAAFCMG